MKTTDIPAKFDVPFAQLAVTPTYRRVIPQAAQPGVVASVELGFPPDTFTPANAGGSGPQGADMNGVLYQTTALLVWLMSGGPVYYDATLAAAIGGYAMRSIVSASPLNTTKAVGDFWISLEDDNFVDPDANDGFPPGVTGTTTITTPTVSALTGGFSSIADLTAFLLTQGDITPGDVFVAVFDSTRVTYQRPDGVLFHVEVRNVDVPAATGPTGAVPQRVWAPFSVLSGTFTASASLTPTALGGTTGHCHWRPTKEHLAGFIRCNFQTCGDASSNATERANADCKNAFTWLWTNFDDTRCPIVTSTGSASSRGANANADWIAHKAISTPDMRGSWPAGSDTMGNSTAGRLANATFAVGSGTTTGSKGNFLAPTSGTTNSHAVFGTGTWYLRL